MFCLTCAFAMRRSDIAAVTMAAISGDSQNAWIDTRGTGSICPTGRSAGATPSIPVLAYCALIGSLPNLRADRNQHGILPVRARILASADGLDRSGAHSDIRWPEGARLDEIARVVDLSRDRRLGGAAEVRIGFVLPSFD